MAMFLGNKDKDKKEKDKKEKDLNKEDPKDSEKIPELSEKDMVEERVDVEKKPAKRPDRCWSCGSAGSTRLAKFRGQEVDLCDKCLKAFLNKAKK